MQEEEIRNHKLKELSHWDNYREAKALLETKYTKQHQIKARLRKIITTVKLNRILIKSMVNMFFKKAEKRKMEEENRHVIMIARLWRSKTGKKGKNLKTRVQNQLR
jgi:hydroxymethylpyrimidine/phosphomethylpyrimidine kinase